MPMPFRPMMPGAPPPMAPRPMLPGLPGMAGPPPMMPPGPGGPMGPMMPGAAPPRPPMPGQGGPTAPFAPVQAGMDPKEITREAVIAQLRKREQPEPAGSSTPQPFIPPTGTAGNRRPLG